MLTATGSVEVITSAAGAALLLALLSLITASLEVIVDGRHPDEALEIPEGLSLQRAAAYAGGALVVAVIVQTILARPPKKGVEWSLAPATEPSEKLFRELIPAWSYAHAVWDASVR
jgi:hypothetical protein